MMVPEDPGYLRVISAFLQGLTKDMPEWKPPWALCLDDEYSHGGWQHRGSGAPFRGDNVPLLRRAARTAGYVYPIWLTEAELLARGGSLAEDARSVAVRIAYGVGGADIDAGSSLAGSVDAGRFRDEAVYNVSAIGGLPARYYRRAWDLMSRNKESRIPRVDDFVRALGVEIVHRVDPDDGARARLEIGTDRIHMPPWALFDSAKDYYVTLAHEAVHWVRGRRGRLNDPVDDDLLLYTREDLLAEVGAAFLCADLGVSSAPLDNQLLYVDSMRDRFGDLHQAVLDASGDAAKSVEWLHQQAPGYRLEKGVYRRSPPTLETNPARVLDMTRDARRFVADTQALRGRNAGRDTAWIAEAVRVLEAANRIGVDGVEVAIQAAVFLGGGASRTRGVVNAADYIEEARRSLRRDIERVQADLHQAKKDRPLPTGRRL